MVLTKNKTPGLAQKATEYSASKKINELSKKFTANKSWRITLTNDEIKGIIKIVKSLENIGISLKESTKNIVKKEHSSTFLIHKW